MNIIKIITTLLITVSLVGLFALSIKGQVGDPIYFQKEKDTRVTGPFESTNSNARYAQIEAIVENKSFFFTEEQARFSLPDVVEFKGNYFSIFMPGVSILAAPLYMLGKMYGMPQLFAYMTTAIFAILNVLLVAKLSRSLGASFFASCLAGFIYLVGSNSLAYALTLTQHQYSVFFILCAILLAIRERTLWNNILLGVVFGMGILIDIPNAFMMLPALLYAGVSHIKTAEALGRTKVSIKLNFIGLIIGVVPLLYALGSYNHYLTGSATAIPQTIGRSTQLLSDAEALNKPKTNVEPANPYEARLPYVARFQMDGLYTLLVSNERGIFYFSPVLVIGLIGLILAYKAKSTNALSVMAMGVASITLLSYSMFGDPYGGWSFGPRYLIPSTAILAAGFGVALSRFRTNIFFATVVLATLAYSIWIASLGALTTNAIPPRVEAVNLPNPVPYTYEYNLQHLEKNISSSLLFNIHFSRFMTAWQYMYTISAGIMAVALVLMLLSTLERKEDK